MLLGPRRGRFPPFLRLFAPLMSHLPSDQVLKNRMTMVNTLSSGLQSYLLRFSMTGPDVLAPGPPVPHSKRRYDWRPRVVVLDWCSIYLYFAAFPSTGEPGRLCRNTCPISTDRVARRASGPQSRGFHVFSTQHVTETSETSLTWSNRVPKRHV